MVNEVVHRAHLSFSNEDTESEDEDIVSNVSPEISHSCFPDKTGVPLRNKLITSFKAVTKTKGTRKIDSPPLEEFLREMARQRPTRYSLKQIKSFTWNFSTKLGMGGFGTTYKGLMPNGLYVAVKLMRGKSKHMEEEFMAEVSILGRIYHRNLVKLLGYCVDGDVKALVYEYAPNGSLDKVLLNNRNGVGWEMLQNIAIETAKGISYLHEECPEVIVHLDIKPGNILLGPKFSPKLADFGLARQYDMDKDDGLDVPIRGTLGYLDPAFCLSGYVTCKCDVYSFGMVLFDILGRYCLEGSERSDHRSFPEQVWDKFKTGDLEYLNEQEGRMRMAALWCIQDNSENRPSMSTVVNILRGDIEVMQPPYPFSSFSKAYSQTSSTSASISSRSGGITEINVQGGPDYESDSVSLTPTTEKYEIEMAASSANLIMDSKPAMHTASVQWTHPANFSFPRKYMNAFPSKFIPYIPNLKDVKGDGNCGFRALADHLGMTENGWISVRKDLLAELQFHWEDYSRLYKGYGSIHRLKHSLEYYHVNAPIKHWMDMPDMGHIIASCYNVVLVLISLQQCLTFLPLRSPPLPEESHKIISIGFVNWTHFVRLDLAERCPIPSIAERWHLYCHPCAKGWETSYTSRIKLFEELVIGENVAMRENPTEISTGSY